MSGQSPRHGGYAGAGPANQRPPPSKHAKPRQMRADFLLNFNRPTPQQRPQAFVPTRRSNRTSARPGERVAFVRGRFVQSAFRLFVEKPSQDVIEAVFNSDELVDWPSVCRVDLLCDEHPRCPICLDEDMVVPKVTRCGHIFCLPCIMRYFICLQDNNGKQRCPVCIESTSPEELTSVRFQMTRTLREGAPLSFLLVQRQVHSTIVRTMVTDVEDEMDDTAEEDELRLLPSEHAPGWHFSRLVRLGVGEFDALLEQELEALGQFRPAAIQAGDTELLPSIDAGVKLLGRQLQKRKDAESSGEDTKQGRTWAYPAVSSGPIWGCSYVEVGSPAMMPTTEARRLHGSASTDNGGGLIDEKLFGGSPKVHHSNDGTSALPSAALTPLPSPALEPSEIPEEMVSAADLVMEGLDPCHATPELRSLPPPEAASPSGGADPGGAGGPGGPKVIKFYQASDGRTIFLEPFFQKLLVFEHNGWEKLPEGLDNVRVERLQEVTVTEDMRKRHKFIGHLPLGSQVTFAHVDLRPHLSKATKDHFSEEFKKRRQQLKKEQTKARKEEREGKSRTAQEEERYYQSLNLTTPALTQAPPTAEDFAVPLPGRNASEEVDEEAAGEGDEEDDCNRPTLAAKIKEQMSKSQKQEKAAREARKSFPALGGGGQVSGATSSVAASGSSSAWGPGLGSSRVKGATPTTSETGGAAASQGPRTLADIPSLGQALAGALESACSGKEVSQKPSDAEDPSAGSPQLAPADAARKKKGRAGKATTIRLFG
mmetsp:Transcript_35252/g.64459  ORF Transcript_35252/g.64459 Transcript_35252/m.64459 type:complete len:767 (+) Transcript_35252:352-2652(+)